MIALGIDTSYEVCVGLAVDGVPTDVTVIPDTRAHAETLLPAVLDLCARNGIALPQVDEIAVGMGPGPFTGLRVGIVTAWTLADLGGIVPRGVCSLDVLARQWVRVGAPDEFIVASDARRKEWYWARYVGGVRIEGPAVSSSDVVPDLPMAGPVVTPARLPAEIQQQPTDIVSSRPISGGTHVGAPERIDASVLAADWSLLPEVDEPLYLRAADATVSTRTKSALPRPTNRRKR